MREDAGRKLRHYLDLAKILLLLLVQTLSVHRRKVAAGTILRWPETASSGIPTIPHFH